jgi:hypothetical protein
MSLIEKVRADFAEAAADGDPAVLQSPGISGLYVLLPRNLLALFQ